MDPSPLISMTTMKIIVLHSFLKIIYNLCVCMNVFPALVSVDHMHD